MKKRKKSQKKGRSKEEFIGFKITKPFSPSDLLPDYEKIKEMNLPAALKATILADKISEMEKAKSPPEEKINQKETIENQSVIKNNEGNWCKNYTSEEIAPVQNLHQYNNYTSEEVAPVKEGKGEVGKSEDKVEEVKVKELPDIVNERIKFKPGSFSLWESSIFSELRRVLSNSEFKIYTVLFEESWAFGRNLTGIIGYKVISERTGLSRRSVITNIEKLLRRRIIERRKTYNNLGTIYKVNLPESAQVDLEGKEVKGEEKGDDSWCNNFTSTGEKIAPVLVQNLHQFPPKNEEETIESQSNLKNEKHNNILTVYTIAYRYNIAEGEKFLFDEGLIKVLSGEEIKKKLLSKPFRLSEEVVNDLLESASPELLSLKIENALFNYRRNLIKKPGEWLLISIHNKYRTSKQFIKFLTSKKGKEERGNKKKQLVENPVDRHLIETVFGYGRSFLKVVPTREVLMKELIRYGVPSQEIEEILDSYPPEYIFFQIKHADFRYNELKNPTSWLISAIKKVYMPSREFAAHIERMIQMEKEKEEWRKREQKVEEERRMLERGFEKFNSLDEGVKREIVAWVERYLREELKIEPGMPGYKINFDYALARRVLEMFGGEGK